MTSFRGRVTVTGKTGAGVQMTTVVLTDVIDLDFQIGNGTIQITQLSGKITIIDYTGIGTVTYSISGVNATIGIS